MSRNDIKTSLNEEVKQSRTRVFNTNDTVLVFGFMFIDFVNKVRDYTFALFTITENFVVEKYMGKRENRFSKRIITTKENLWIPSFQKLS